MVRIIQMKNTNAVMRILKTMRTKDLSFSQMIKACLDGTRSGIKYFRTIFNQCELDKIYDILSANPVHNMEGGVNLLVMSRMFPKTMGEWMPNFNASEFIENPDLFVEKANTIGTIERDCLILQMIFPVCRILHENITQHEFDSFVMDIVEDEVNFTLTNE